MSSVAALRYAEALFELAADKGVVDAVAEGLLTVVDRLKQDAASSKVFFDPRSPLEAKKELVAAKVATGCHVYVGNLLKLLCDRHREDVLMELALSWFELKEARDGVLRVTIESAQPIEPADLEAIRGRLGQSSGKKVIAEVRVLPELIGGIRLVVGSTRIDGTIKRKYEDLAHRLKAVV